VPAETIALADVQKDVFPLFFLTTTPYDGANPVLNVDLAPRHVRRNWTGREE